MGEIYGNCRPNLAAADWKDGRSSFPPAHNIYRSRPILDFDNPTSTEIHYQESKVPKSFGLNTNSEPH